MDEKISLKAVEGYCETYARKVSDAFFTTKDKITGPEILTLTEIRQVNLFIIRELMVTWIESMEKSKSPYFDYEAKEVKDSFVQFQNTVSNHISIQKKDFFPLLKRALNKTIFLVMDPYDFYSDVLDRPGQINTEDLRTEIKYVKINRAPLEKLVDKLSKENITTISGNEAFAQLDHILEEVSFSPEDIEGFIAQFSKVVPLEVERLYEVKNQPKRVPVKEEAAPLKANAVQTQTLADELAKQKPARIKDKLTINQKFMFTKILFHGDFEIFSEAIDKLDNLDNLKQAMDYLNDQYPEWDRESEEYEEFVEVVERRFL
jgi:hypothetical protein